MITADQELDARGLNCPLPILRTKKAIATLASGQVLKVIATDPGSVKDIESYCRQTGNELLESQSSANDFQFMIRKA
jgi:tRNA 2-thiouridine synthesizing protein A